MKNHIIDDFNTAVNSAGWFDVTNALADDTDYAYATGTSGNSANGIILKNWNGSVPTGATIKGFAVKLWSRYTLNVGPPPPSTETMYDVYLTLDGSTKYGTEPLQFESLGEIAEVIPPITPEDPEIVGSGTWLFMTTAPTPAEVNSTDFGIFIEANGPNEWGRDHSGINPSYSSNTPTNTGRYSSGGSVAYRINYAQLIVFYEEGDQVEGEANCEGDVTLTW